MNGVSPIRKKAALLRIALVGIAAVCLWAQSAESAEPNEAEMRGRISGVVVSSATDKPVAGAYVAVDHSGDAGGSNLGRFRQQGIYVTTESDQEGRFVLEGVAFRDDHPFMVTHPGFVRHQETIALRKEKPEMDVRVRLKPGATIALKVVDAEGNLVGDATILRLEAKDGRPFFPMRADWPDLPYRVESTTDGTFSFGELDTGLFSIEAIRVSSSAVTYHRRMPDVSVLAGETKEVQLKPADHRTTVRIKIAEDPYASLGEMKGAVAVMITRNPAQLAWAGRNFYHPEDDRLGRVWKSALIMGKLIPLEDADVQRKLQAEGGLVKVSEGGFVAYVPPSMAYSLVNFPPGEYAVFTLAMGMYKDWKSPAIYLRGAKAVTSPGKEQTVEIPWVEPIGPSPTNARVLYTVLNLEANEYTAGEICDLLVKETDAKAGEIVADASIQGEKLKLPAGKLQIWDLLERAYLEKGWRLEADFENRRLVLRFGAP
jgi:hypothetical protein